MKQGIIDRKVTKDFNIDIVLLVDDGQWATALHVNDCGRFYGIQLHPTAPDAQAAFNDREVRFV